MNGILKTLNNLNYSRENLEDGKLKLTIEISNDRFELGKEKVYQRLAPSVEISGFRAGQAPKNMIVAKLGPTLFEETLSEIIPQATLEIIRHENLIPLDQIAYNVEKVAQGTGVKFTAIFSVLPEFDLPEFKSIDVKKEGTEITPEEVDKVIDQMFQEYKAQAEKDTTGSARPVTEMNDEWAASLSLGVKTIAELKEKIQEELKRQKETMNQNKYVDDIMKQLIEKSSFAVPSTMLSQEMERKEKVYTERIEKLGMKLEDFLKNQQTTLEELKKGWKKEAEETIKAEIILMKLSQNFKVTIDEGDIDKQIAQITDEKMKKQYDNPNGRAYIRTVLLRQKVVEQLIKEIEGDSK